MLDPEYWRRFRIFAQLGIAASIAHALLGHAATAHPQTGAAISGAVLDAVTRRPVESALVQLVGSRLPPARTNASGEFRFEDVPAGPYRLHAQARGYLYGTLGDRVPEDNANVPVNLGAGSLKGLRLSLWAEASVRGAVVTGTGRPIAAAQVQLLKRLFLGGVSMGWERVPQATGKTDDRGEFGITGISPGDYVLAVLIEQAHNRRAFFYPSATRITSSAAIRLSAGATVEVGTVVMPVPPPSGVADLRGVLRGEDGAPASGIPIQIVPTDSDPSIADLEGLRTVTSTTGGFEFLGLPKGTYSVQAVKFPQVSKVRSTSSTNVRGAGIIAGPYPPLPPSPTLVVSEEVELTGSVTDRPFDLRPGARLSGRIRFDDSAPRPHRELLNSFAVFVRPSTPRDLGDVPIARVEQDGSFESVGLPPGAFALWALSGIPPTADAVATGWKLATISKEGRNITGLPIELGFENVGGIEILLTTRQARIVGTVEGDDAAFARVVAFPRAVDERAFGPFLAARRISRVVADDRGMFQINTLPGDYLVAAVPSTPAHWMNEEFLQTLTGFTTRVNVRPSDTEPLRVSVRLHR